MYDPLPVDIWALSMLYCHVVLPDLPWKRDPIPTDVLDDTFGIFSTEATIEQGLLPSLAGNHGTQDDSKPRLIDDEMVRGTINSLVSLLPEESRQIIGRMLEPNPKKRAKWSEILVDEWVRRLSCQYDT